MHGLHSAHLQDGVHQIHLALDVVLPVFLGSCVLYVLLKVGLVSLCICRLASTGTARSCGCYWRGLHEHWLYAALGACRQLWR